MENYIIALCLGALIALCIHIGGSVFAVYDEPDNQQVVLAEARDRLPAD